MGAIGYSLITGQPVFNATSLVDLCQQHVTAVPEAPSQRLGRSITPELESALLACLEKTRAKRPQTARELAGLLNRAPAAESWSLEEAEAWWGRHERSHTSASAATAASSGPQADDDRQSSNGPSDPTSKSGMEQTMALDQRKSSTR